ncbi:ABC transporter permease [Clostridium estertheticum]|uniref:ABC transporter permease n=1 Tax=Clostridium estertheticum TaxID=238834 RepID=UPI0013E91900|nr:ABC transporter permease [Clostridium estertheticum]MBN4049386.1 ABC transporter permease [bacterium AH-315-N14]MBZ9686072.1 ABC transporter permease [Clostridium estertheticum]
MKKIKGLIIPLVIIIVWIIVDKLHVFNSYIIPSPNIVLATAFELLKSGALLKNLMVSFARVIVGFAITFAFAFPLAIFLGSKPKAMPYLEPFLEFMRHIPPIAMIPILILWLGIGESSKFVVIFLATFFPIFSNTLNGVTNYDKKLLEVGEIFHFSKRDKFFKIIFPQAVPSIITGIQLGLGYSWRSLMGAELIAASSGIGYMIIDAEQLSRPDIVIVGILSIGLLGYFIDYFFIKITKNIMRSNGKGIEYGRPNNKKSVQDI